MTLIAVGTLVAAALGSLVPLAAAGSCSVGLGAATCTFDCPAGSTYSAHASGASGSITASCGGGSEGCVFSVATNPSCNSPDGTSTGNPGTCSLVGSGSGYCTTNGGSVSCSVSQPVHTYGAAGSIGVNSNTLSEQTSGAPTGSIGGTGAGVTDVQDTNVEDCNGDGVPGDFDGDYDFGLGGAFFGSSNVWDVADNCGYALNVHSTSGVATDVSGLPVSGAYGVDDVAGPTVVTDPTTGATVSCQTDGSITPDTDANDCLNNWVGSWAPGTCGATGGDDGYWLFLNTDASENAGALTTHVAVAGTLAASF